MIIKEKLLIAYGAKLITLKEDEYLFISKNYPENYFQIKSGNLKITSTIIENTEYIHDFLSAGDPVGESFLFSDDQYNVDALALNNMEVYVLYRLDFHQLLASNPDVLLTFYKNACKLIAYKMMLIKTLAYGSPKSKILAIITHLKKQTNQSQPFVYKVPFTRKQLAAMTGLRVETVIRTFKVMELENTVKIIDSKIFL